MSAAWWRPYTTGRGRWLVIVWELVALAFLQWTAVRLFSLEYEAGAAHGLLLTLLWLLGSWRIMQMGVYVNEHAMLVRQLFSTTVVTWSEIDRIVVDQMVHRIGPLAIPGGATVMVHLRNGSRTNTPLWAEGIDFHGRPDSFRQVCEELRRRHTAATGRAVSQTIAPPAAGTSTST